MPTKNLNILLAFLKNNVLLKLLLLLHCSTISHSLFAQNKNYVFTHYTAENGLLSNSVSSLFQDKQGYLWIGTMNGLQRFDGKKFVNYVSDLRNPNALQTNWISSIYEDSKGRLWIGTLRGSIYTYNRITGKFYDYNKNTNKAENKLLSISRIVEDANNDIWVSTLYGYYKLNNQTNEFENYSKKLGFKDKTYPSSIAKDKNGNLWFCGTGGLKYCNVKTKEIFDKENNPKHWKIFDITQFPYFVGFDRSENIWFTTPQNTIGKFNANSNTITEYSYKKILEQNGYSSAKTYSFENAISILSSNGNVIIGLGEQGIALYNETKDNFTYIPSNKNAPVGLHNFSYTVEASGVLTDREGLIWIFGNNGLEFFNPEKQSFHFIQSASTLTNKTSLPLLEASGFIETKNDKDIYVSYYDYKTTSGIYRLDSNFNIKQHYLVNAAQEGGRNQLWGLFQDNKGIIWSPTQDKTILKLNPQNNTIIEEKDTTIKDNINIIEKDSEGNIWLGGWTKGLRKIDHKTNAVSTFTSLQKNILIDVKRVYSISFDGDSLVWAGSGNAGLVCFDKRLNRFTEAFMFDEKDARSISSNIVTSVLVYNADTLLVGTSEGINIFDKKKKTFSAITSKNGLPSNFVESIFFDNNKNIWVCGPDGFCRLNPHNWQVINYGNKDGIISKGFTGRHIVLNNGKVLVATTQGFMAFNPENVTSRSTPPNVTITAIKIFDKKINYDSLFQTNTALKLNHSQNTISIEFASLEFSHIDKIKYYYQLENIDKEWVLAGVEQTAYYNQLTNGTYTFKVKCENGDGVFCNQITTFTITILPPFYKTWWFILLEIIFIILAIFFFIKWRNKSIYQKRLIEVEESKIKELETEKLKNQLEIEQVINFFSFSLVGKNTKEAVLWDVAKNLIGELNFHDCVIYLWNESRTSLVKQAGFGSAEFMREYENEIPDIAPGENVVGDVMISKEPIVIKNVFIIYKYKAKYPYRPSIIAVPILFNNELIGVIDSEHPQENYFTNRHLQLLTTIAAMVANKLHSLDAEHRLNKQLAETKMQALRSQMNPHFVFNSLNSINHFILSNDTDNASNYLTKFSRLIRLILDNSRSEWGYLDNEIKALELYIQLEAVRFDNAFTYNIAVDENVSVATILIPPLIIQPYVENAIWHGLLHKQEDKGKLQINIWMQDEELHIKVTDNGVGREKAAALKSNKTLLHKSHGMKITSERLEIINNLYKMNAQVTITDLKDEQNQPSGTSVLITIKPKKNASNNN